MKNSKSTKRALLLSVLSMLLCAAMLAGSTFAWFTDSVVSGNNKIVAGNLDVELRHSNGFVADGEVKADTPLFVDNEGNPIKWEPGVMAYENFTVKNAGSLALKFNMTVNASNFNTVTVDGVKKSLKDVLKAAILEVPFDGNRDTAKGLNFDSQIDGFAEKNIELAVDAEKTYAIVIYWEPSDVDNDYNLNNGRKADDGTDQLYIDLGVNLVATQAAVESDSFGSDYDENAVYPVVPAPINVEVKGNITNNGGGTLTDTASKASITVPAEAVTNDTGAAFSIVLKDSTPDSATYDISLTNSETGDPVELNKEATVTVYMPKNLKNVKVAHDGTPMDETKYKYMASSGKLTITTASFSPFKITYEQDVAASVNGVAYSSFKNALNAAKDGDTIVCNKDSTLTKYTITKDITIDLNGHKLTGVNISNTNALAVNGAKVTVKNGTISAPNLPRSTASALMVTGDSDVTIENCTLETTSNYDIVVVTNGSDSINSKILIRNSTIKNAKDGAAAYIPAGDVTFENCDVTGYVCISGGNVTLDGGTYTSNGFGSQGYVYTVEQAVDFLKGSTGDGSKSFGDAITILDKREGYTYSSLTIRNITFNTKLAKTGENLYAITHIDMMGGETGFTNIVIEGNTYNNDGVRSFNMNGETLTNP